MHYYNEGFKSLDSEKEGLVHNKLDDLSRGLQIDKARIGALKKKPFSRFRPGVQAELQSVAKGAIKKSKLAKNAANALIKTNDEKIAASHEREAKIKDKLDNLKGKNNIRRFTREEIEFLVNYLLNESYVHDENSALKIVECMSEKWASSVLELNESSTGERHRAVRHGPSGEIRQRNQERIRTTDKIALRKAGYHRNRNEDRFPQHSSTANSPHHSTTMATYKNQSDYAIDSISPKFRKPKPTPTSSRVSELKAIKKQMRGDRTSRQVHNIEIETDSDARYAKNDNTKIASRGRSFKKELKSLPKAMKDMGAEAGDHVVGTPAEVMRSAPDEKKGAQKRANIYNKDLGANYNHRTKTSMGRLK